MFLLKTTEYCVLPVLQLKSSGYTWLGPPAVLCVNVNFYCVDFANVKLSFCFLIVFVFFTVNVKSTCSNHVC